MERVLALQALVAQPVAASDPEPETNVSTESNACSAQSVSPVSCGNAPPDVW